MLYRIENGAIVLGNKTIIEEINFLIKNREHVALVGRNGSGKSTLLRAIKGEIELSKGLGEEELEVTDFSDYTIGYIKQEALSDERKTMLEEILGAYGEILETERKLSKLEKELAFDYSDKLVNKYQDLYLYYKNIGGYDYKKEYETAIKMFGFTESDKEKKIGEFSYGQRMKIAFLRLVLSKPDLLLLDEPTNHLDIKAIEWLERYLADYSKMLVVVSHDRMFLDRVCDVVYEIEYGSLTKYVGNYSYFEKQKELDYERNLANYERQQKEFERLRKIADRFRYKPSKASMALSKLKQIERMVKIEKPREGDNRSFARQINPKVESYRDVLKVKGLKVGYDEVLGEIDFSLERGERLGIIGENGSGKSTFLKTIMGQLPKLGGKLVWGNKVELGYFDQNVSVLNDEETVLEFMRKEFPWEDTEEIRRLLGSFEFYGEMVFQKIGSLSGGQKVKLLLCKIMKSQPNVLILDEPTNHLDIISKRAIEELLFGYKGTIIFVSHDRYLIRKIATSLLVFETGRVDYYQGNYDYYLEKRSDWEKKEEEGKVLKVSVSKEKYVSSLKERSKLERRITAVEKKIQKVEEQIEEKRREMMKEEVYIDIVRMNDLQLEVELLEQELEEKMLDWECLMQELEK